MSSESQGARLKRVRLEKGISLEEAHKKTKLHINVLKAIEEDSIVGISPVYLKGFLKIYSKYLGLEPSGHPMEEVRLIKQKPGYTPVREPVSFLKISRARLANLRFPKIKGIIVVVVIIFSLLLTIKITSAVIKSRPKPLDAAVFIVDKSNKKPVSLNKISKVKTAARSIAGVRLGLRAKEDCWIQVKVDGRLALRGILKKNRFESWTAKERIDFTLGDAGVVGVEVNGNAPSVIGRRGETLRNISLTKDEGLTIKR
jgi:transcriptional regulator with XRE-family HTH domain